MEILCFESGGTKLVAAIADRRGDLIAKKIAYRRPEQSATETVQQLLSLGRELTVDRAIGAIGFGFGGTVQRSKLSPGACYHEGGWNDVDLAASLTEAFDVPFFIENDCNLAALAEAYAFRPPFKATLLYITIGTGIGGGVVRNGSILQLGDLGEAEIGHLVVDPAGPACPCGNRGCLEMLCSGPGLETLSARMTGEAISAPVLMEAFRRGDPTATSIAHRAADYLAAAVASAANLLAPSAVVLGGGVMRSNTKFLNEIEARSRDRIFPPFLEQGIAFSLSRLQEDVVCQGAALHVLLATGSLEVSEDI